MTHPIDQVNYDAIMQSCPKCGGMNTVFGFNPRSAECLDCGFQEIDGKPVEPEATP